VLILSRKRNEDIVIKTAEGRVITIKVIDIIGDRTRLGFIADDCVSIVRKELLHQKEGDSNGLERPAAGGPVHSA
jgi:carbon storage regulator CsrA